MREASEARRDAPVTTVAFVPNRLNRQPVIVRGMTADELWITVGASGAVGLGLGIALAVFTGSVAAAPASIVVGIASGVFAGGSFLRRHKRGRPETWLSREIHWQLAKRAPKLAARLFGEVLILRSGYWGTRRARVTR